ncbi:MAG: hypothetical protein HY020_17820 [Burkholderiales bacterium]|nr:hypothetical protein [Burkholderiales bacterium]
MELSSALGWLAASLMLLTFLCHDAVQLRRMAILANLAFIGYGFSAGLPPVLYLHLLLLPINVCRLLRLPTGPQGARSP